jgi:hypothetical protein
MQDIVEAAKRAAASAADRASWEINRRQRATARQHDIELARRERSTLMDQILHLVVQLDAQGKLTDPSLHALCSRLRALDGDIASGEREVRQINAQQYAPGSMLNGPGPSSASRARATLPGEHPCPTCGQLVKDSAAFCSSCGTRLR